MKFYSKTKNRIKLGYRTPNDYRRGVKYDKKINSAFYLERNKSKKGRHVI
jgi:hypothetical protein